MRRFSVLLLLLLLMPALALAQSGAAFPSRPIRLLVPAAAGGGADILARALAAQINDRRGWNVVVENKPGAGGNIAAQEAVRSTPDGHTLLLGDTGQLAINGALYPSMAYAPLRDFTPIGRAASFPFILVTSASVPAKNVAELVALAKKSPGTLAYASTGVGAPQHLGGHLFVQQAGIDLIHVPFKGGAPALTALLGGEVPIGFIGIPPTLAFVRSGKLHALAISTRERSPLLPDVPTMAESGFPDYEAAVWFGLVGPAGLPGSVVQTLSAALRDALADPGVAQRLKENGLTPTPGTPDELARYMRAETAKWSALVKATGAKAD